MAFGGSAICGPGSSLAVPLARVGIVACVDVIVLNYRTRRSYGCIILPFTAIPTWQGPPAPRSSPGWRPADSPAAPGAADDQNSDVLPVQQAPVSCVAAAPTGWSRGPRLVDEKVVRQSSSRVGSGFDLDEKRGLRERRGALVGHRCDPWSPWTPGRALRSLRDPLDPRGALFAISRRWCEESGEARTAVATRDVCVLGERHRRGARLQAGSEGRAPCEANGAWSGEYWTASLCGFRFLALVMD